MKKLTKKELEKIRKINIEKKKLVDDKTIILKHKLS